MYPGADDLCNGLDDDCDGDVDEHWPELGAPCTAGVGGCEHVLLCHGAHLTPSRVRRR